MLANRNYNRVTATRQYIKDRIMSFSCQKEKGGGAREEKRRDGIQGDLKRGRERGRFQRERERERVSFVRASVHFNKDSGVARRSSPRRENRRAIKKLGQRGVAGRYETLVTRLRWGEKREGGRKIKRETTRGLGVAR